MDQAGLLALTAVIYQNNLSHRTHRFWMDITYKHWLSKNFAEVQSANLRDDVSVTK